MSWVTDPTNQLLLHFLDDAGKHATMSFNVGSGDTDPGAGGPSAISDAAAAISESALYETEVLIRASNTAPGTPTQGPYARPADKAAFVFSANDGTRPRLEIGGPNEDIVGTDSWTVDPTNAAVIALVAAMNTHATTASGGGITGLIKAQRRRPPRRKGQ